MLTLATHYLGKPSPATAEGEITLRKAEHKSFHPYVTHFHNLQDGGYYHGHYFETEQEARKDFTARVNQGY